MTKDEVLEQVKGFLEQHVDLSPGYAAGADNLPEKKR